MNVDSFLEHHGLSQNPFEAEEARHDPVFERLSESSARHPDFGKILGRIDRPSTSVVFGEKGTGKTAIRLMIAKRVAEHNEKNPDHRTLLIAYDDLNPWLDRLLHSRRGAKAGESPTNDQIQKMLEAIRLVDHQDAILSLAVTKLVDALLDQSRDGAEAMTLPSDIRKRLKQLPRETRSDIAALAALYDQPRGGAVTQRAAKLRGMLRLRKWITSGVVNALACIWAVIGIGLFIGSYVDKEQSWMTATGGISLAAALVLWAIWGWRQAQAWNLSRRVTRETPSVGRNSGELRNLLLELSNDDVASKPWPTAGDQDVRFQLTDRLLGILRELGYVGIVVLVDRIDEPTMVVGRVERMQPLIWPMFDSKFLQQQQLGLKLLLPIELRHALRKESTEFFQEARLDKQNLIDRLEWSGTTLYDLCNARLAACAKSNDDEQAPKLSNLFDENVSRDVLIDALDQMHQPRDAFKFLYAVIQEHCQNTTEDEMNFRIPKLTLETVRKSQSQRVQDLYRGLSPA